MDFELYPIITLQPWFFNALLASKVKHKDGALIPGGRNLIDTAKSFVYRESGLRGDLLVSRLTGLSRCPTELQNADR